MQKVAGEMHRHGKLKPQTKSLYCWSNRGNRGGELEPPCSRVFLRRHGLIDWAHWSFTLKPLKGERLPALTVRLYYYSDKEKNPETIQK